VGVAATVEDDKRDFTRSTQPNRPAHVLDEQAQFFEVEGLQQERDSAQVHGRAGGGDRSSASDHDDGELRLERFRFLKQCQSVHVCEPDILNHEVDLVIAEVLQGGFACLGSQDVIGRA